ncbi:Marvel domain [Trinorchestia longiramus]|nr:Marvel domain [Trinorchestia longiramus]
MEPGTVDPGFPDAHMTTTTTRVTPTLRFDPSYIRTIPGIIKIVEMILNLIGYISISVSINALHSRAEWFGFVSMTGFWLTGFLLVFYVMHVIEKFHMVPWLKIELGYTALWTFFYFTASLAAALWGGYYEAYAVAAFFGFAAMLLYGADAFLKFRAWRAGDIAQGEQTVQMGPPELQSPGAY